jgi:hypothetical protein
VVLVTALFPLAPKPRWTGSRALVPLDPAACPSCAGMVTTVTVAEPPLFRHAGYGGVRETTSRVCVASLRRESGCRWGMTAVVTEANPRRYGAGVA